MINNMTFKLFLGAIVKFICGVVMIGALLFVPAWTLDYPKAWLFMTILFIPMLIMGAVMMLKSPELLKKRLNSREKESVQKSVVKLSGLVFIVGFVLAALDFRFSWLVLPDAVSYIFTGVFLISYAMYAEVMRENTYLSRTVEVSEDQKVIDTGFYGIVRHPMYTATLLMFLSIPLVLGSLISFAVFLAYPIVLIMRIKDEERLLEKELSGYTEYKKKVRYRLIPFIW